MQKTALEIEFIEKKKNLNANILHWIILRIQNSVLKVRSLLRSDTNFKNVAAF